MRHLDTTEGKPYSKHAQSGLRTLVGYLLIVLISVWGLTLFTGHADKGICISVSTSLFNQTGLAIGSMGVRPCIDEGDSLYIQSPAFLHLQPEAQVKG